MVFLECLSARLELEGAAGPGVPTAERSVTSLRPSSPCLKEQGEKSRYRAIIAEIREEGAAWGLLNWSFVSPSLFASSLLQERLPVILDSVALGMLCTPPAAATGHDGLKCPCVPSPQGGDSHCGCYITARGNALGDVVAEIVLPCI